MEKFMTRRIQAISLIAAMVVFVSPMFARYQAKDLSDAVRHELVMLPYYNIFDDLGFYVDGGVVTLTGDVTWPVVKSDAEHAVKKIPGVTQVLNNIKVLPLSPMDNQIRRAEYQAIFRFAGLYRYAMGTNPSIHIIVDNGQVTLIGVVDNEADKNMVYIRANGVPGVFSVTNDLRVAEKS
jgi:hyperosmotically inducible periplasmic protein